MATPSLWAVNDIIGLSSIDLGVWSPAVGNVGGNDDFCVTTDPGLGASGRAGDYGVRVAPLAGSGFDLTPLTAAGPTIPVLITFQDLLSGVTETLVPSVLTARNKTGTLNCTGNNAQLSVDIGAADLAAVPPGEYLAPLRFSAQRANRQQSVDFNARIRVLQLIRISGLDPVDLGTFDGANDALGGDDFCVYTNSADGAYTVTAYTMSPGGALVLASGTALVPYTLEYDDGSGFVPMPTDVPVSRANAFSTGVNCDGGSNASIRVRATNADLRAAPAGNYSSELTLLVSPM